MSLIAHRNLKAVKLFPTTSRAERPSVALAIITFVGAARRAIMKGAGLFAQAAQAVAKARQHKATIEVELYRNRYKHSSKSDDDLPIVR